MAVRSFRQGIVCLEGMLMRFFRSCVVIALLGFTSICFGQQLPEGRLMRFPDIYKDKVVFSYAGDLWLASASGGEARRITTSPGLELFPKFSPDGKWIAFTAQYDEIGRASCRERV